MPGKTQSTPGAKPEGGQKKQFSLTLVVRILIGVIVLVSIGVFANGIMYYNQRNEETAILDAKIEELTRVRDELVDMLGSAEELQKLLNDYNDYKELIAGTPTADLLEDYRVGMAAIRELSQKPEIRKYLEKKAREQGLEYADAEIFFNDNQ